MHSPAADGLRWGLNPLIPIGFRADASRLQCCFRLGFGLMPHWSSPVPCQLLRKAGHAGRLLKGLTATLPLLRLAQDVPEAI